MGFLMFVVQRRHILLPKLLKRVIGPFASALLFACAVLHFGGEESVENGSTLVRSEQDIKAFAEQIGNMSGHDYSKEVADLFSLLKDDQMVGILLEGPKGELLAGQGDFLTRDGRRYRSTEIASGNESDELIEVLVRDVGILGLSDSGQQRAATLRVFRYESADLTQASSASTQK